MHVFVVDSNVIWSLAYHVKSAIGQFIMADSDQIKLYAPEFLKEELENHFDKIVQLSGQSREEVNVVLKLAYAKIHFIADEQIPFEFYRKALPMVRDIDMDDLVFVALNEYMNTLLWTGDIKLLNGLRAKGYEKAVSFTEVKKLIEESKT